MLTPEVRDAAGVDPEDLDTFLARHYSPAKVAFLRQSGRWWHRGDHNRWVVTVGGRIAAYCAVIPCVCLVEGRPTPAVWWVDLFVAEEHRGTGLQRLLDLRVRDSAGLVLGFPNALAARVHRRHGWGVSEVPRVMLLPLRPANLKAVEERRGLAGLGIRAAAAAVVPAAAVLRGVLTSFRPGDSWQEPVFDARRAAALFAATVGPTVVTTLRDPESLAWRYAEGPDAADTRVFAAGPGGTPAAMVVTRTLVRSGRKVVRILDVVGSLDSSRYIGPAVRLACGEAARSGAVQVTVLASNAGLRRLLLGLGFVVRAKTRFCWWSRDSAVMDAIGASPLHWVLGDSDNDEP